MDINQIQKRLEIINLSIKLNDTDSINVQVAHLHNTNHPALQEIATLLENKNYKQAQYLINKYKDENSLNDMYDFLDDDTEKVLNVHDMLKMSPIAKETIKEFKKNSYSKEDLEAFAKNISMPTKNEYDSVNADEYIEKNILNPKEEDNEKEKNTIEYVEETKSTHVKKEDTQKEETNDEYKDVDGDTPLDELNNELNNTQKKKKRKNVVSSYKTLRSKFAKKDKQEEVKKVEKNESVDDTVTKETVDESNEKGNIYPPIAHLTQKYRKMFTLYPPIKESDVWVEEIAKFIKQLSTDSYTDKEIEDIYNEYQFYLDKGDIAKASQFLLLLSSTDSNYSKFMLARELFKGKVLKRDIEKSYKLMVELANKGYGDAICDLGQFFEYGIGVTENKKKALKLYEKAFELGVNRATKHINRIKESSGLLKKFFG